MNSDKTSDFRKKITDFLNITLALVIVMFQGACKKNAEITGTCQLVLEGYLYQGEKVDSIHFTSSLSFESLDTVYPAVLDAQASISWNGKSYALQSIGGGYYNCADSNLVVMVGNTYSIVVNHNGRSTSSSTVIPNNPTGVAISDSIALIDTTFSFGPPGLGNTSTNGISNLKISWDNPDNGYYYVVIESTDPNSAAIVRGNGNFPGGNGMGPGRIFRIRSQPFQGNNYILQSNSLEKYGKHVAKVYRVNQEYADLYMNRQQDSRNLSEPITNVTNGLGIFTGFSSTVMQFTVKNAAKN